MIRLYRRHERGSHATGFGINDTIIEHSATENPRVYWASLKFGRGHSVARYELDLDLPGLDKLLGLLQDQRQVLLDRYADDAMSRDSRRRADALRAALDEAAAQ